MSLMTENMWAVMTLIRIVMMKRIARGGCAKAQKCHGTQSTEFGLIVVWPISMVWDWASQPPHPHPGKDYFDPDEEVFTISLVLETAFSLHLGFQLTKNLEPSLSCALFWTLFFYSDGCYDNANENMRSVFFQQ